MWAFEQIYTGNKYFSLSAIFFVCIFGSVEDIIVAYLIYRKLEDGSKRRLR